jgi:hypothetical protein
LLIQQPCHFDALTTISPEYHPFFVVGAIYILIPSQVLKIGFLENCEKRIVEKVDIYWLISAPIKRHTRRCQLWEGNIPERSDHQRT